MLTNSMKITTKNDAHIWASQILGKAGGIDVSNLAIYLWENHKGECYGDVRDIIPNDEKLWDILDGKVKS